MRGFYSGFAAAFAVLALASLLWVGLSLSQREASDLLQWDAVAVVERSLDAGAFLSDAMADAALDAAFAAHGCQQGPAFCTGLSGRVPSYAASASARLSGRVAVNGQASLLSCAPIAPDAAHQEAYLFSVLVSGSAQSPRVAVPLLRRLDFAVQVNASPAFDATVNASPALGVTVACPPFP